ncbi:hypothetical protein BN1708_004978 [Verticillium longisporum]|uniref:Elongation factor 1-alpha n=1 Tax=Verticillium longisporum TaxID=100787 RepID=A0A0G4M5R1_VERLO|nr:hypothetical protein BN1708_004978 [Verticillium longisporum]
MSNLNSWEDDPAAQQDENLSQQAQQQLNINHQPNPNAGSFRPGVASFQPGAQSFNPGQQYAAAAAPAAAQPTVKKEGGAKVLSIGGEAPKPKAKVLSIGATAAPPKEVKEEKKEPAAAATTAATAAPEAGAKATAAKAIEKTGATSKSGKTSPAPSSGRSSPPAGGPKGPVRDADAVAKEQSADVDDETLEEVYGKEHVNIIFIGHVDAGKSTLGGSILYATGMVDERTMDKYRKDAKDLGRESWYLSWVMDLTAEERSKGKTVEVGRGFFETEKRRYSILDAPGHKTYVPSMIGGASQADVGILVISARKGEYETGFERGGQTREHAMLAKTQGHVNIIFIGHVDAGKSTLGGSILYATGMVDERTMDKYRKDAKDLGRESWYLSWVMDLTAEERSKGKTVEVGRGFFETEKRRYSILDAPGHKTYVPSMIGGASQADVGILVISARKGEYETGFERGGQTREHAMLAKTQGVNKLVVVINKMDDPTKGTNRKSKLPPSHAKRGDSIIARMEVTGGAGSVCVERFEDYPQMGRFTLRDQGQTIAIGKITKLITNDA